MRGQTPRRPTRREHVELNTNADGMYLFCLIDVEWKLYEANLPRRLSTLWEARYLNRVAHLSKGLDGFVQHTEFTVASSCTTASPVRRICAAYCGQHHDLSLCIGCLFLPPRYGYARPVEQLIRSP